MGRTLIIDASLNKRIATDLKKRGRRAKSAAELGLKDALDPELLTGLSLTRSSWVLVTADDNMPGEHADEIAKIQATIATIDPRTLVGYTGDAWFFEVIHRWAHAMENQRQGTIRRYSVARYGPWRPLKRKFPKGLKN